MRRRIIWLLSLILMSAFSFILYSCVAENNEIDRCDDESSGAYIQDDQAREKECK